ncbi:hypothetical protein VI817_000787 [Penicillium citrinum]|nr:hypothetical protein VI817_000787 [Penicillium citrinum]
MQLATDEGYHHCHSHTTSKTQARNEGLSDIVFFSTVIQTHCECITNCKSSRKVPMVIKKGPQLLIVFQIYRYPYYHLLKTDKALFNIPLHHNFTVSLINQTLQYQQYAYKPLSKLFRPKESLIAIWIGINDINDSSKYSVDFAKFYENLIKTVFNSVTDLYNLGHRSFLFMNLPPLDRTPGNQASSSPHPNATQIKWYNDALIEHAHLFQREKMDVEARVFDAHTHLSKILDHPARYGIVNTTNYCAGYNQPDIEENYSNYGCPTPLDQYFWFNSGHMTSHVHQILAEELQQWLKSS